MISRWLYRVVVPIVLLLVWAPSCSDGSSRAPTPAPVTPAQPVTLSGQVTGSGGLADVTVSAGGESAKTDVNGFYRLADVPYPEGGRLVVSYEKTGYATYQRSVPVKPGQSYTVAAHLAIYDFTEVIDPTQENFYEDQNARVRITMPADSVVDPLGGQVKLSMAAGDPTTPEGRATFPGDYMAAMAASNDPDTPLESVAYTEITIEDSAGDEVTTLAKPATVRLRLPDEFQDGGAKDGFYSDGSTIEWWSYDESSGTWLREDADPDADGMQDALVVDVGGVLHAEAKINHLSWWNADHPLGEHACICVKVLNDLGQPIGGVEVLARGLTYNGTSRPVITDSGGAACVNVKRTTDPETPERVRVLTRIGLAEFHYDVTTPDEGDVETDAVFTPAEQGSTIDGSGQCKDLENTIEVAFRGKVQGTVTYDISALPVVGETIFTSVGASARTDAEGEYSVAVPVNVEVLLFVPGLVTETVTVTSETEPEIVNFVLPNRSPIIDSLTRDPEGCIDPGNQVVLTVTAHDDDGDPLTYTWTSSAGALNATSGTQVTWTAPAGTGTATVEVTVADDKGAETRLSRPITWGGCGPGPGNLVVFVRDNPGDDQPVEGAYVVLHGADNVSVESVIITGADGKADFGEIQRSRVTLTLAHEKVLAFKRASPELKQGEFEETRRNLYTLLEIAPGSLVYYVDMDELPATVCSAPVATVGITAESHPLQAMFFRVYPSFSFAGIDQPASWQVCQGAIQDDGKLSFWAEALDSTFQPLTYGFLVDQDVADLASYPVNLDRDFLIFNWQATSVVLDVLVGSLRKGVWFPLAEDHHQISAPVDSGTLRVPNEFPVGEYFVSAIWRTAMLAAGRESEKRYQALPGSLNITMPDYEFSDLVFDEDSDTLTWSLSGQTPRDALLIYGQGFAETTVSLALDWTAALAPDRTTFVVPDLPPALEAWLDEIPISSIEIEAFEVDTAGGFDELVDLLRQGDVPEDIGNELFWGWASFPDVVSPPKIVEARRLGAARDFTPLASRRSPARRIGALSGLTRQ